MGKTKKVLWISSIWRRYNDHVAFVLMLPLLGMALGSSIVYPGSIATPIFIVIALVLWCIALIYDLMETTNKEKGKHV